MLKQILLILGAAVLLMVLACAGIIFWAQRAGSARQEAFFKAVDSGDPAQVLALCDPALRDEIDAPVLAAWMNEVRTQLGEFQGLSKTNFNTSSKVTTEGSFTESKGTVNFVRGSAESELMFRNDLLVQFTITSDKLPDGWFKGPADTALYRSRGEQFLTKFLQNDTNGAFAMMHEKLQEAAPRDKLKAMSESIVSQTGPLQSITFEDEQFSTDEGERLTLHYRCKCEKLELTGEVVFRFVGLKGHLAAFNVNQREAPKP